MVSLADQLKNLQIPGKKSAAGSHNYSILFDKNTAAKLDNDAVFNIGVSGFKQILSIDPLFAEYEESLFSRRTIQMQRVMLDKAQEKRIKKRIDNFLILLSPYLQLQSAKKCLEWLVRRFEINVFDKDALMRCILPFHETQLFARILQIVSVDRHGSVWDHILPKLQKSDGKLNTRTLVHHCSENRSLLDFVCNLAEKAACLMQKPQPPKSGLQIIFSFYARLVCGVVGQMKKLSEDFLSVFMPVIDTGLKSGVQDYVCSSYMVITIVLSKGKLARKVMKKLSVQVLKSMEIGWYDYGLLCMISIIHVKTTESLSSKILTPLLALDLDGLVSSLLRLEEKYEIGALIQQLFLLVCDHLTSVDDLATAHTFVNKFLEHFTFDHGQLKSVCLCLIEHYVNLDESDDGEERQHVLSNVLKVISTRYVEVFDSCMNAKFLEYKSDTETIAVLKQLASICLSKGKVQLLPDVDLPLVVCLNHPEKEFRRLAVKQLFASFKSDVFVYDSEFLRSSVLARLHDDDADVVNAVLKNPKSLSKILSLEDIKPIIEKLSERTDCNFNLNSLYLKVVKNLDENPKSDLEREFFFSILGQIFLGVSSKKFEKIIECFQSDDFETNNPLLIGVKEALSNRKSNVSAVKTYNLLVTKVASKFDWPLMMSAMNYCKSLPDDHVLKFITHVILLENIERSPVVSVDQLTSLDFSCKLTRDLDGDVITAYQECDSVKSAKNFLLKQFQTNVFDSNLVAVSLAFFLKFLFKQLKETDVQFKKKLFAILIPNAMYADQATNDSKLYQCLLKDHLENSFNNGDDARDIVIEYCAELLLMVESDLCEDSLKLALSLLSVLKFLSHDNVTDQVIGLHLALLSFPHKTVRKLAVGNLSEFASVANKKWSYLVSVICEKCTEITRDMNVITRLLESKLNPKNSAKKLNDFDLSQKKGSKPEKKKKEALENLKNANKTFHMAIRLRVMEMSKSLQWGDDFVDDIIEVKMTAGYARTYVRFYEHVLDGITKLDTISQSNMTLLLNCLNAVDNQGDITRAAISKVTLCFHKLSSENKLFVIRHLLELLDRSSHSVTGSQTRRSLKEIKMGAQHVCLLLNEACEIIDVSLKENKAGDELEVVLKKTLDTIDEILVAINDQIIAGNTNELVTAVFAILSRCCKMHIERIEFTKQLCLSLLHNITKNDVSKLSFHRFKVDLLLDCLRTTTNTHTKENCLQTIASAAILFPAHILHNVMEIFTFMGGTFLRLDNEHSFQVIKQTIDTVVPILLQKHKTTRKRVSSHTLNEIILFILRTFIDSCPHCPEHRRDFILSNLLKALGEEHLQKAMLLLIKKITDTTATSTSKDKMVAEDASDSSSKEKIEYAPITLEFCYYFFSMFDAKNQLAAFQQMVDYLITIPLKIDHKIKKKAKNAEDLFDLQSEGEKQMRLFTYSTISFLMLVLRSDALKMAAQQQLELSESYLGISELIICYADKVEKECEAVADNSVAHKYGRKLLEKIGKMMAVTFTQIPLASFLVLVGGLLKKDAVMLRKKALQLLSDRLEGASELTNSEKTQLLELFKTIRNQLENNESEDADYEQLLLFSIKVLVPHLLCDHSELFLPLAPFAATIYSNQSSHGMVSINAMLLVAEVCAFAGVQMLPHLELMVKPVLEKIQVDACRKDSLLITSCMTCLHKIFASLSQFMSPYITLLLEKIAVCHVCKPSDETAKSILSDLKNSVGELTDSRLLLPAIEQFAENAMESEMFDGVLQILEVNLSKMSASDVNGTYSEKIISLFQRILDKQCVYSCHDLQQKVIAVFCQLALRMTEKSLRSGYSELYKWATIPSNDGGKITQRLLTFYRLSVGMATTLRGLFLLFVSELMEKSGDLLQWFVQFSLGSSTLSSEKDIGRNLLVALLDCLSAIFLYDSHGYINRERFQIVANPLIEQLECRLFDESNDDIGYTSLITDHLLPCVVNLAAAVNDAQCWKTLNHLILTKTKSTNSKVRFAALEVVEKVYEKLGESFMIMIPETIPYLSEVLEDESVEVEEKCRKVILQIEQISGESMQKYF